MSIIGELVNDARNIIKYRNEATAWQHKYNRTAPRVGDMAPDFTLYDSSGTEAVTLSDFRGKKPVALVFGSYT